MKDFRSQNQQYEQRQGWISADERWRGLQPPTAAEVNVSERMGFVRKVYALFFAATLFAIVGVGLGMSSVGLMRMIVSQPLITLVVLVGAVFGAQAVRHVPGVNLVALFGFTTLTGLLISPAIYYYGQTNPNSIWQAGVLTVGIFGALTAYVFISKKDFNFMRGMVMTGLTVVVLAVVLNFFLASSAFSFAIAAVSLLVFSGFVLYHTSNIIRRYPTDEYVAGALDLYLDAFNIFMALLRILNAGRR